MIMIGERVAAEETFEFLRAGPRIMSSRDNLTRLVQAVLAAQRWERGRRSRGRRDEKLRVSELRYPRLFELAKDVILILDAEHSRNSSRIDTFAMRTCR